MSIKLKGTGQLLELEDDPRWQLVERIVASPSFAKTERLSSFLTCVCHLAQTGQFHHINEQHIGAAVFGRSPDYDPGVDSIVRSHASRLLHRLQQYFEEEGAAEELILTIPKGGYVPTFESRSLASRLPSGLTNLLDTHWEVEAGPSLRTTLEPTFSAAPPSSTPGKRRLVTVLIVALAVTALLATVAIAALWMERRHARMAADSVPESVHLFWREIFGTRQKTIVINADSGVVILQNLTKKRITLDDYLSGDYLKGLPPTYFTAEQTVHLGTRRYTSIVDLMIMNKLFRIPGLDLDRTQFRFAPDIRMDDIKQGNLVLLGTYESTPWVQLFEPSMNFYFRNNLSLFCGTRDGPKYGRRGQSIVLGKWYVFASIIARGGG